MRPATQAHRPLRLATTLGPDVLLAVSFAGREAMSEPFRFQVEAVAERDVRVDFDRVLGRPAAVALELPFGGVRYFHGICSRLTQGETTEDFKRYRLEVVPHFDLLRRRQQCRIYQQKAVPDILKELLAGVDVELRLAGTYHRRDYCVQYRENDFDFASRLMEEEGIFYFFLHAPNGHRMVLADSADAHPDVPGANPVTFRTLGNNAPLDEDYIYDLDKTQELTPSKVTLWDHTFELPHRNLASARPLQHSVAMGEIDHNLRLGGSAGLEVFDWPGGYAQRFDGVNPGGADRSADIECVFDDGPRTVRLRSEEIAAGAVVMTGRSKARQLASGHKFRLNTLAGDARATWMLADGEYVVKAVEHEAVASQYRSGDDPPVSYSNSFSCIPLELPFRPARRTAKPVIAGTQSAEVVGPAGMEIFTDKYGRVKVKFHWDRQGQRDGADSCWVRVSQVHAGRGWGGIDIPRIGEEVIVAFEEGDPDKPIIVGRVYNPREHPPFQLPQKAMVSGLKSNTTPGGGGFNEISLDDSKGAERMFIHAQYNQDEVVLHDQTSHVVNNRTKKVDVDEAVTIGNNRQALVGVNENVEVGANHTHTVGANHTESVGTNMSLTVGAMKNEMVGATSTETVGAAKATTVGAAYALTVGGAMNVAVGLVSAEEVGLTKKVIVGEKLEIVVGAARLIMEASGAIKIIGTSVLIDGGKAVDVKAGQINLN